MTNIETIIQALANSRIITLDGPDPAAGLAITSQCPEVYPASVRGARGAAFALINTGAGIKKLLAASTNPATLQTLGLTPETTGTTTAHCNQYFHILCPTSEHNAAAIRTLFPFTAPVRGGIKPAIGLGDRTGIATPGHIRALRGRDIFPILPQQSVREMHRTTRTPRQVIDDVTWAVLQEGYQHPFGADADHLKTPEDIRTMAHAGFTMFTIDPSDHINPNAHTLHGPALDTAFNALFNGDTKSRDTLLSHYQNREFKLPPVDSGPAETLTIPALQLKRIAVTYLPAVRHTIEMARLLQQLLGNEHDLEISVDETDTPTTPEAHLFVAHELQHAGITPQSLAPRFTGQFQKGIDFIGDIHEFQRTARLHAMIARTLGPYKLSIHSGSDKFTVFPIIANLTAGLFHEKTAGTSYLEAIRVIANRNPALYRELHQFALTRFPEDRASYHVTTDLDAIPPLHTLADSQLPALMDDNNARQLMHITYGSALTHTAPGDTAPLYRTRIYHTLNQHENEHYNTLAAHITRHLDSLNIPRTNPNNP